jgi:hypothetical protein
MPIKDFLTYEKFMSDDKNNFAPKQLTILAAMSKEN